MLGVGESHLFNSWRNFMSDEPPLFSLWLRRPPVVVTTPIQVRTLCSIYGKATSVTPWHVLAQRSRMEPPQGYLRESSG